MNDVRPVPPLVVASVPATVIAPCVAVEGVRPVVPKERLVTPKDERLDHDGADEPLLIKTWLEVPAEVNA